MNDDEMQRMFVVPLTQGFVAVVDEEDYEAVMQHKWYANKNERRTYAVRWVYISKGRRVHQYLHQFIMGQKGIDHINHDGLDNQRSNLRAVTTSQNAMNRRLQRGRSSKYKGVTWDKNRRKWRAQIEFQGESHFLKNWDDEIDAARAYDQAACHYFGEFAYLNFPEEL